MDTRKQVEEIKHYLLFFRGGFLPILFTEDRYSRRVNKPTDEALQGLVLGFETALNGLIQAAGWAMEHDPHTCGTKALDPTPCAGCFARMTIDKIHKLLKKEMDWSRERE